MMERFEDFCVVLLVGLILGLSLAAIAGTIAFLTGAA